jgi:hypothetical protein
MVCPSGETVAPYRAISEIVVVAPVARSMRAMVG